MAREVDGPLSDSGHPWSTCWVSAESGGRVAGDQPWERSQFGWGRKTVTETNYW
jgi:hypothetical protein